ncbi:MAG: winged helix-turn-helix domain-containing protein [Firmicutes bacterium]|nr:winged helix-turn-helix domain-containing protein [Bacillota bacterium]
MKAYSISTSQAKRLMLAWQQLLPPRSYKGKQAILDYLTRVGCIQYDPINVAGFNHNLVLQARIKDYQPPLLRQLLYKDRKLVDHWDKNMSIYPAADWPYFARQRARLGTQIRSHSQIQAVLPKIRQELSSRGPLSSRDLDFGATVDWYWAPARLARAALESAYFQGELLVHHKSHTRKYYDFAHKHLPADIVTAPDPHPDDADYHDWYVLRRIGSVGLLWNRGSDAWLGMRITAQERNAAFARLRSKKEILPVSVPGIKHELYTKKEALELLDYRCDTTPQAAIIAPLDNLLWDRNLVKALFGFSYRWEVYKPAAQREYGYYVLPVLYGDRFIARFEPTRDKKTGALIIKNWWWEDGITPNPEIESALVDCFDNFIRFLAAPHLENQSVTPLNWVGQAIS